MTEKKRIWKSGEPLSWYQAPFEVVLLEIAPKGEGSVTGEDTQDYPLPTLPSGARELTILSESSPPAEGGTAKERSIHCEIPPCPTPSIFALVLRMTDGDLHWRNSMSNLIQLSGTIAGEAIGLDGAGGDFPLRYTTVPEKQNSCWLVFRIPLAGSEQNRSARLTLAENLPADVTVKTFAHVVPEQTRMGGHFF